MDFHDQAALPDWFRASLWSWLANFHVVPRTDLAAELARVGRETACDVRHEGLFRGYAQYAVVRRNAVSVPAAA